jgi:hypothetical protein
VVVRAAQPVVLNPHADASGTVFISDEGGIVRVDAPERALDGDGAGPGHAAVG